MMSELITSKHLVFKCYTRVQTGYIDIKERKTWNALQKRAAKQSHDRDNGMECNQLLCFSS